MVTVTGYCHWLLATGYWLLVTVSGYCQLVLGKNKTKDRLRSKFRLTIHVVVPGDLVKGEGRHCLFTPSV